MATKENSTREPPSTRSRRPPNAHRIQNFLLVWLDGTIDEINNEDCRHSITKLRQVINDVNTFTDVDECIDLVSDIEEEKIFMISSAAFGQKIVPITHDMAQVSAIYIFCEDKARCEKWAQQWSKIQGVFTDITLICEALKTATQNCDQNSVSISLVKKIDGAANQNHDELDQSFMYTQILKEILLSIDFEQEHIDKFIIYCREQFDGNTIELKNIEKLEKEYRQHQPIWWYTYQCFLYSMLNCALRTMDVGLVTKMGFFVRELHNHIATLHSEQYHDQNHSNSFIVYRGQGLSQKNFEEVMKTKGGLLSFNNFLSTSLDRMVSLAFAESNQYNPDTIGVLFKMIVDSSIASTPFANVRNVGYYPVENEILFSMHSVFRIGHIKQIDGNNRLWQVELTLTGDNDPQLQALTESMREETASGYKGWHRLGKLMIKLGQFNKAEELYDILLRQTTNEGEKGHLFCQLGWIKNDQGEYAAAIEFNDKALEIRHKTLPANHPDFAQSYNNIGMVYNNMSEYSKALSYYEKVLEIYQKTLPANHPNLATSYNNIGLVYRHMGEYSKALSYYEKALEIQQKTLPANHPLLATSYNNIGTMYYKMGYYRKALSYYEKALEIFQKTLPANHPTLATSYNNIGGVYHNMGEYSKALSYYEKALEIQQKTLPANHPDFAQSYNNIGAVYYNMGEYSKALSYNEKALEIFEKTLPANHPDLATSYNNIGLVYNNRGEYSKALSYYEKALEIQPKTLPANHPLLATSYNNIGGVYHNMGEYSKALSYYEKALEIRQKTLPENHPDLASSHTNIGNVYHNMGEHSKALSYYEKALEIQQKTLPANHPDFATPYNNIGWVYRIMADYSKAITYYEKALEIQQKTLPANHPHLAGSYNNIACVYRNMRDYRKALSYYEKAHEIARVTLPANDPSLATSYNNIGLVYDSMSEYSKALSSHEKALEIRQKTLPENHPHLAVSYSCYGSVYDNMGEYSEALSYFERALDIWQRSLPPNNPHIKKVKERIEIVKKKL